MSRSLLVASLAALAVVLAACASKPVELQPAPAKPAVKLKGTGALAVEKAASGAALEVRK